MLNLLRNPLYLRLQADRLRVLHVESGKTLNEPPLLAWRLDKGRQVPLAVGNEALALRGRDGVELVNGFQHPRTLLADFSMAAQTLKLLLRKLLPPSLLRPAATVVLQPLEQLEGGLTQLEIRGLVELLRSVGARQVYLWIGAELGRDELERLQFPAGRGTLLWP